MSLTILLEINFTVLKKKKKFSSAATRHRRPPRAAIGHRSRRPAWRFPGLSRRPLPLLDSPSTAPARPPPPKAATARPLLGQPRLPAAHARRMAPQPARAARSPRAHSRPQPAARVQLPAPAGQSCPHSETSRVHVPTPAGQPAHHMTNIYI